MKQIIIWNVLLLTAITLIAQVDTNNYYTLSTHTTSPPPPPFDGKTPPPINIDKAYAKVLSKLGDATNQFYCVSATCLNSPPRNSIGLSVESHQGWIFTFSTTNGASKNVYVYFDKASSVRIETPLDGH